MTQQNTGSLLSLIADDIAGIMFINLHKAFDPSHWLLLTTLPA